MLLRSASSPILNSLLPNHSTGSSPEPETLTQLQRTRSVHLITSFDHDHEPTKPNKHFKLPVSPKPEKMKKMEEPLIFSSSGLGVAVMEIEREQKTQTLVVGGGVGGSGSGGGVSGGGRGSDGSDDDARGNWHWPESTDKYYEAMIEANPGNLLLCANYAKFLKEVKGDFAKAEKYCERAIVANPSDANVLSLYADLIWQTQRDAERAESYFVQAVETDPNDCYVMASYARFLWDAEDDDDDVEQDDKKTQHGLIDVNNSSAKLFQRESNWPPVAAAS